MEQHEVFFTGQVQGVGFRWTTCRIASRFEVTGFVKNLEDGRVQLVAEGRADELERFVGAVQQQLDAYIGSCAQSRRPATGQFAEFRVRY